MCRTVPAALSDWTVEDCRLAAHSWGISGRREAQSYAGCLNSAHRRDGAGRPGTRSRQMSAECWSGRRFPAGCWSAGWWCCGSCICRRHALRQSSGNCPRKPDCRWNGPRLARRQRSRRASRRLAFYSQESGRCWNVRRRVCRRTVPRRRRKSGSRTGSHQTHRRISRRKRTCRRRLRRLDRPLRLLSPGLPPCAPLCWPACPAGSVPRR